MKEEIKTIFNQFTLPTLIVTVVLSMGMSILNAFSLLNNFTYFIYFGYVIASYLMLNAYIKTITLNSEITKLLSKLNDVDLNKLNTFDIMRAHHNMSYSKEFQSNVISLRKQIKLITPIVFICIVLTTLIELPRFNFGLSLELFSFSGTITLFNINAIFISFVICATLYLSSFKVEAKRVYKRLQKIYQQATTNDK